MPLRTLNLLSTEQIIALRPHVLRPLPSAVPAAVLHEFEAANTLGDVAEVTTVLLRGSECGFHCSMCDLWKSTHLGPTPPGNLPAQIAAALGVPRPSSPISGTLSSRDSVVSASQNAKWIKLYNASNFFASYNVPTQDLPEIAERVHDFERVIVENHPLLVSPRVEWFANQLNGRLEVAMGLETVEPQVLRSLNKRITVEDVRRATATLIDRGVDVRLFVLLRPPGLSEQAAIEWCLASIESARSWGARHVSVIPVRGGNGAMEQLASSGQFEPPLASSLEQVLLHSVAKSPMVVTADTWDWKRLRGLCTACSEARRNRVGRINLIQKPSANFDFDCDCTVAAAASLPTNRAD